MPHTGLFFGSFNPVHIGHLILAQYFLEYSDLDEIWFVVSPQNPFKQKASLLDGRQRLYLVELAIADPYRMKASDIEFSLPSPSYTITTLEALKEKFPERAFSLIMGMDNLDTFHKWRSADKIIAGHKIYVYPRKRSTDSPAAEWANHPQVKIFDEAPLLDLSATFIRKAIRQGKNLSYTIPEKAWTYIQENHFYK